jgi:uncharacterized repeat protein (TIGR03803 family)
MNRYVRTCVALTASLLASASFASGFQILYDFQAATGTQPQAPLVDSRGIVFGVTSSGGLYNEGVLYQWDGSTYTVLHDFGELGGLTGSPSNLVSDGTTLYGLIFTGGFKVWAWDSTNGYRILKAIETSDADPLVNTLAVGNDGMLYVDIVAHYRVAWLERIDPATGVLTILQSHRPIAYAAPLVAHGDAIYGASLYNGPWSFSTRTLKAQAYHAAPGPRYPGIGFANGSLYGTVSGGTDPAGFYRIDPADGYQFVVPFGPLATSSVGNLATGGDGDLYGIFEGLGENQCGGRNSGFIYQFDPVTLSQDPVHEFCDPDYPVPGLATGPDGTLYGTVSRRDGGGYLYKYVP